MGVAENAVAVRPVTPDDVSRIVNWMMEIPLWQRYGIEREPTEKSLLAGLDRGDIVLTVDETEPAIALVWCLPDGMFGRFPYIRLLGVDSRVQSKGIGAALLDAVETRLSENGQQHLFLLVSDFNLDAQRFYERHGFVRSGALPDLVVAGVDEILYHKVFDPLSY